MNKTVKWILIAVGALIGLIVIAALCLPLFIDPNDYKDKISQVVQEKTGRGLSIPGDIKLDVSLIGLKTVFSLGDVNLSSSKDFPETEFLSSKLIEINLALWPLIKNKELKVNKILLEGVNVNLVRNEAGISNWEDLVGSGKEKELPEQPVKPQDTPSKDTGKGLAGIDIGGILAKNINVTFTDKQVGRIVKLNNFNLDIGHLREDQSFPFKANFELLMDDANLPPISATIDTSSNFTVYLDQKHFVIDGFNFKGLLKGDVIPSKELALELSADMDIDLQNEKIDVKKLAVKQGDLQIETVLSLVGLADPRINGTITIPEFSPRTQAESLGFPLQLEDPNSLTKMSAGIDFSMDLPQIQLKKINLNLDNTSINGTASVKDFQQPAFDLTLHINELDIDRYKMKKTTEPAEEAAQPAGGKTPAPQLETAGKDQDIIPVEQLRGLTFNSDIKVDKFKAAKMNISNIDVKASGIDGVIKLEPFAADLYDGSIKMTAEIDARPDIPEMHVVKDLKGVQLGPMTLDMTGKEEMKGKADIHVDVTTKGLTRYDLNRNANGNMSLSLADGEIAKLKIIDTIRTAKALLGSKEEQQPSKERKDSGKPTTFASLTATGIITNGVFKNNDLLAESELMKVEGKGTVDLADELVDYLLTIHLADRLERDEETGLVNLGDTPIPYRIKGTFDKIEQSAALEELLKSEAKKVLFKEIEKQLGGGEKAADGTKQDSSGGAEDLINKGLKSLFGN